MPDVLKYGLPTIGILMIAGVISCWQDMKRQCALIGYEVLCSYTKKKNESLDFVLELILWQFFAHGAILLASSVMTAYNRFLIAVCTLLLLVGTASAAASYKLRPISADFNDPAFGVWATLVVLLIFGIALNILVPGRPERRIIVQPQQSHYDFFGFSTEPTSPAWENGNRNRGPPRDNGISRYGGRRRNPHYYD